jgi:hypothetical protein
MSTGRHHPESTPRQDQPLPLRAGPLQLVFAGGDLRYCRLGEREVVRRIYGAVRDRSWGTVPGSITDLQMTIGAASFEIRYLCEHRENGIHFAWQAGISGTEDGTIHFQSEGEARSTFLRNRIGLCLLHPIRECAGARCRANYADGTGKDLRFPEDVAVDQPIPGFTNLAGLNHEIEPGVWLEVSFDGDLFETEDQRNWIDASFKTYSTPLGLPYPVEVQAGTRIRQAVTLRLRGGGAAHRPSQTVSAARNLTRIHFNDAGKLPLPKLGLGMASHGERLSGTTAERLSQVRLSHLRVDLRLSDPRWPERLRAAAAEASQLGTSLELAVHLPMSGPGDLPCVGQELQRVRADVARALVFREGQRSTLTGDWEAARRVLAPLGIPIGVGTDSNLYELHLQAPPEDGELLCWSMNPQVHATDELSIAETPEAVSHQLATLRRRHPGRFLTVSPLTLKPRCHPVASQERGFFLLETPLPSADVRQTSLFAAAWTLAMVKALAEGGTGSVTLFETSGSGGIADHVVDPPIPGQSLSPRNGVFPIYHVLRDIAEFGQGKVIPTETGRWVGVASLCLESDRRRRLIVANLSTETHQVVLENIGGNACFRLLDSATRAEAMSQPEAFRARSFQNVDRVLDLRAHAIATIDITDN